MIVQYCVIECMHKIINLKLGNCYESFFYFCEKFELSY